MRDDEPSVLDKLFSPTASVDVYVKDPEVSGFSLLV
jgi:hypothetical protein